MVRANSEEMLPKDSMLPPLHSLTLRSNRLGVPTGVKPEPKSMPKTKLKLSGEISKQSTEQKKPVDLYEQAVKYLHRREKFPYEDYEPVYRDRLGYNVIFMGKEIPLDSWQSMQREAKLDVHGQEASKGPEADPESNPKEEEDPHEGQHYFDMSSDPYGRPPSPYYEHGGKVPEDKRTDPYRESVFYPVFY